MENLIKKKVNIEDANGWYSAEKAYRKWNEDFIDEDTGEIVSIERNECILPIGELLNPINVSLLQVNGITDIMVSNKKITGNQEKYLSLWQLECVSRDMLGKERSQFYLIPKGSPLECELFFKEWAVTNIDGGFTIKKVVPLDFSVAILPYNDELEEAGKKNISVRFYKATIKDLEGGAIKIIIMADSVRTVESEVFVEYIKDSHNSTSRIVEIKELNVKELFEDGINIKRYTLASHNPYIESHFIKQLSN